MFEYEITNNKVTLKKYIGSNIQVTVPAFYLGYPVNKIGKNCFRKTFVRDVVIEEGIEVIDVRAFSECIALEKVQLPNTLKVIENRAFFMPKNRTRKKPLEINLPEGIQKISSLAFQNNGNQYLVFPESIQLYAMQGENDIFAIKNRKLEDIDEVERSQATIGYLYMLKDQYDISEEVKEANRNYIQERVVEILEYLMNYNKELIKVLLSDKYISYKDYDECADLLQDEYKAEVLEYKKRFFDAKEMQQYLDYKEEQEMEGLPAYMLKKLWKYEVITKDKAKIYQHFDPDYNYEGTYKITAYLGNDTYVDVPSHIGNKIISVVEIHEESNSIESIAFEDGIRFLSSLHALEDHLKEVYMTDSIVRIESYFFNFMPNLETVQLSDNIHDLGYSCFERSGIQKIEIPEGVKELPEYCFYACPALESVVLPDTLETIGDSVFGETKSLHHIDLPSSLKLIQGSAFHESGLHEVVIPEGVEELEEDSFSCSYSLKEVTLPKSLKKIGKHSFANCISLQTVHNKSKAKIDKTVFEHVKAKIIRED